MIRKRVGDQFWLITQQDHARVAGVLARAVGNRQFAPPANPDVVYAAVDAHDDGWPLHDDAPTLNEAGLPADVFELPRSTEHPVWLESALRATRIDPYAGLLVSLHGLSLSAMAASMAQSDRPDDEHRRRQFDLNKISTGSSNTPKACAPRSAWRPTGRCAWAWRTVGRRRPRSS
jgi:hypothetical protein